MKKPRSGGEGSSPKRTLLSSATKATAHPTREVILRELGVGPRSTLELEEATGEDRYNLYHHLGVLEQAQLVGSSISSGRTKLFELLKPKRPEVAYLMLDGEDEEEAGVLRRVLEVLREERPEAIPRPDEIRRAKMVFYYPWSAEE
ncbi:MAG: winged helix-turn-helix domain-containing protein [Gemmatimonadota bacterium]|nr:winged helix-turn-helix domain-containing protein [Gemmatimonadota bacterium]